MYFSLTMSLTKFAWIMSLLEMSLIAPRAIFVFNYIRYQGESKILSLAFTHNILKTRAIFNTRTLIKSKENQLTQNINLFLSRRQRRLTVPISVCLKRNRRMTKGGDYKHCQKITTKRDCLGLDYLRFDGFLFTQMQYVKETLF